MNIAPRWIEPLQKPAANIEKAGAARSAQKFPPRCSQHIAADGRHVDRDLSQRLRGIHEKRNIGRAGERPDGGGGIDQAAIGGTPGEGDEFDPRIDQGR